MKLSNCFGIDGCYNFLVFVFCFAFSSYAQDLTPVFPKHDDVVSDSNSIIKWNKIQNATSYELVFFSSTNPSIPVKTVSNLLTNSWTLSGLPYERYTWLIKANVNGTVVTSAFYKFDLFVPSASNNVVLWLDAADVKIVNDRVEQWVDKSKQPNTSIKQMDPNKRPFIIKTGFAGLPQVQFKGNEFLDGGDILNIGTKSRTMFAVANMVGQNGCIYAKSKFGVAQSRYALNRQSGMTYYNFQDANFGFVAANYSSSGNTFYTCITDRSNGFNRIKINNTINNSSAIVNSFNHNSEFRFLIGAHNNEFDNGEVLPLNGGISELIFTDQYSEEEENRIRKYLLRKYSPPIDLGFDTLVSNYCSINLTAPAGYSNYTWSTGALGQVVNISKEGIYWVEAKDQFGFVSRDTIQVNYPKIPSPPNNFVCLGENTIWNANLGSGFTYVWSTGATTPSLAIGTPGTYSVTIKDALGCSQTSQSLTFTMDTYKNTASLGPDNMILCSGNLLSLNVGADETVSYAWQGEKPSSQSSYAVSTTGNYWVKAINKNGCVALDTVYVTIKGTAPIVQFSTKDHCENSSISVINQSLGVGSDGIVEWKWDFGNGAVSQEKNPTYTYPLPGKYDVSLFVKSVAGCGAKLGKTLNVFAKPRNTKFTYTGSCERQAVQFKAQTIQGNSAINTYQWTFEAKNSAQNNTPNISHTFNKNGVYDITLKVIDEKGCADSVTSPILINPTPIANFNFLSDCVNNPIQFLNQSNSQGSSNYLWDFSDNTSSNLTNPAHTFQSHGTKTVSLIAKNLSNCTDSISKTVEVYALPLPKMKIDNICVDSYLTLEDSSIVASASIDSSVWIINKVDTLFGSNAFWLVNALGQHQVELFTWSDYGCSAYESRFINAKEQLNADFSVFSGIVAVDEVFEFKNLSTLDAKATWDFGDGTSSTDFSPKHSYKETYVDSAITVVLTIWSPTSQCIDSAKRQISIKRANLEMEVSDLFLEKTGDWYLMGVEIKNKGTQNLAKADFIIESPKGLLFNEVWEGILKPTEDSIYLFKAMPGAIFSDQDAIESYVCVSGKAYDSKGNAEPYLENNKRCRNIEGESSVLLPIYPNPTNTDFKIRIFLSHETEVYLTLDDMRGKTIKSIESGKKLQKGYYEYPIDISEIVDGIYVIQLKSGGKSSTFKLSLAR
jgi:PKD repeat protein